MSVVMQKSFCIRSLRLSADLFGCVIRFVIVCFTEASIMWFGQPGHHVTSDEVPRSFAFGLLVGRFACRSLRLSVASLVGGLMPELAGVRFGFILVG